MPSMIEPDPNLSDTETSVKKRCNDYKDSQRAKYNIEDQVGISCDTRFGSLVIEDVRFFVRHNIFLPNVPVQRTSLKQSVILSILSL